VKQRTDSIPGCFVSFFNSRRVSLFKSRCI